MKSIGAMIQKLEGCIGTSDLSEWEESFMLSILDQSNGGRETDRLSDRQVEKVQQLYNQNFSG